MRGRVRRSCRLRRGEGGGRRRRLRGCRGLHCWCGFGAATRDTLNSVPCRYGYHWLNRHYYVWSLGLATGRERHNQPQREQQELWFAELDQHCEAPFQIRANGWSSIWRSLSVVKCPVGCLGGRPPIPFDRFQSVALNVGARTAPVLVRSPYTHSARPSVQAVRRTLSHAIIDSRSHHQAPKYAGLMTSRDPGSRRAQKGRALPTIVTVRASAA